MGLEEERRVQNVQQLALKYAESAREFFSEKYANRAPLAEVALFYGTASATMVGSMYSFVHLNAGKEAADAWLSQCLGMVGAVVRSKGTPVVLEIEALSGVTDAASDSATGGTAALPPCICALDPSGTCLTCPADMKDSMRKTITFCGEYIRKTQQMMRTVTEKKTCGACRDTYLDASIASVIMESSLGEVPVDVDEFCDQLFAVIQHSALQCGIKELPLTEKAWAIFSEKMSDRKPENLN